MEIVAAKIFAIMAAVEAEALGQEARPAIARRRANQHAAGDAFGLDGNVEHPVNAVVQVHVGVTGWSEEDAGARGRSTKGVGGGIVFRQVGFDFGDAVFKISMHESAAQKIARDFHSGTRKEATI